MHGVGSDIGVPVRVRSFDPGASVRVCAVPGFEVEIGVRVMHGFGIDAGIRVHASLPKRAAPSVPTRRPLRSRLAISLKIGVTALPI